MENKGLLFIPDISGFTRFVTEMEIEHSSYIIQELLEVLIDANQLELEVSEIEGDAILFYKFGTSPDMDKLYSQVASMFCAFHRHLMAYEHRRLCQCKACTTAINLTLKVITHYGEFTGYNVKNFYKLIGKDVIVAHQLLKNDIRQHEYWLVTKNVVQDKPLAEFAQWMKWDSSTRQTETGEIFFHNAQLGQLKNELQPEPELHLELSKKVKMISVSKDYDTDIKKLFFTAGHYELRNRWQVGVKTVDEVDHLLPGVGTRYHYVLDDGETTLYTSGFAYDPEKRIVLSETDEKKRSSVYYIIEKTGDQSSRLTLDFYIEKNSFRQFLFKLKERKKMEEKFRRSLANLGELIKEIELPVEF